MIEANNNRKLPEPHERITTLLMGLSARKALHHAYLFIGPSGVGKRWIVNAISQKLLKQSLLTRHPDFSQFDAKNDATVENVRTFIDSFASTPLIAEGKIGALINADELTVHAQNALLKTLEEPPKGSLIILTASHTQSILPTILSRCNLIRVPRLSEQVMDQFCSENHFQTELTKTFIPLVSGKPELLFRLLHNPDIVHQFMQTYEKYLESGEIGDIFKIADTLTDSEDTRQDIEFLLQRIRKAIARQPNKKMQPYLSLIKALIRLAVTRNHDNIRLTIESAIV